MADLTEFSLAEARDGLAAGDFSSRELTEAHIGALEAARALDGADLVFVHIEAPDEAGHMGDAAEKVKAIEANDEQVIGPMLAGLPKSGCPPSAARTKSKWCAVTGTRARPTCVRYVSP